MSKKVKQFVKQIDKKSLKNGNFSFNQWRPQWNSNPCCRLERPVSWASRRWGRSIKYIKESGCFTTRFIAGIGLRVTCPLC